MDAEIAGITTLGTPVRIQVTLEEAQLRVVIWKGSYVSATILLNADQIDQLAQVAERAAGLVVRQTAHRKERAGRFVDEGFAEIMEEPR